VHMFRAHLLRVCGDQIGNGMLISGPDVGFDS
jgi:hypothetical protein